GNVVLATFSDGDPAATSTAFTPSVDWGGALLGTPTVSVQPVSTSASASNWEVVGTATYAEKESVTVAVTVDDADGGSLNTCQTTFSVADAPLNDTTAAATLNAVEGNSAGNVVVATFTDGNPFAAVADFTPSINWGGAVIGTPTAAVQFVSKSASVSTWQVV